MISEHLHLIAAQAKLLAMEYDQNKVWPDDLVRRLNEIAASLQKAQDSARSEYQHGGWR